MGKKNKPIIIFSLFALVVTSGVAYLSSGFQKWDLADWKDKVKPIVPTTSDTSTTSEEPTTSEDPITSEEPITSEVPVTSEVPPSSEDPFNPRDVFLSQPVISRFGFDVWEGENETFFTARGVSKTVYKTITIDSFPLAPGVAVDFNSVRFEATTTQSLKFGFPGTVTTTHSNSDFKGDFTYASTMVINAIYEIDSNSTIDTAIYDQTGDLTSKFEVYVRTDNHLAWAPISSLSTFRQDANFIQFALSYQTNNKSTNAMITYLRIEVTSAPEFVIPENTYGIQMLGGHTFYDEEGNFASFGTTYYHRLTNYNDFLIIDVENPETAVFPTENSFAVAVSDVINEEIYFSFVFSQEAVEVPEGKTNVVLTPKKVAVIELETYDSVSKIGTFNVTYRDLTQPDFVLVNYSL